jgi:hypothetical protein
MSVMDILECKNCKMIGWLKMDERVFETGLLVLEQTTRTPLTTRSDPSIRLVSPHKNFLRLCLSTARLLTLLTYRSTMTIDKHNPTQQRQQPQSLTQALSSLPTADLGLPVCSIPNARQDPREHREFLRSILQQAIELANGVADYLSGVSSSDNTDGEDEENSRSQTQNQKQKQKQ